MSVLIEFSMFPLDMGVSLSEPISELIEMISKCGLPYRLTAMGTIIETKQINEALALVEKAYHLLDNLGSKRVYASIKLDIRKDRDNRLTGKIDSIQSIIGKVDT